jgi:Xeroderma pigmentosum group B helicase damage recognition domain
MVSPAGQPNERAGATRLRFDRGTLLIEAVDPNAAQLLPGVIWDPRVGSYRAPACKYRDIVQVLQQQGSAFLDLVSQRTSAPAAGWAPIELRPYQQAA